MSITATNKEGSIFSTSGLLKKKPLIIAGPCSAESREQVLATAKALKQLGKIDILRAGIWKPRTRPGYFEGMGEPALPWMQEAQKETGLPFCVEVASAGQVETALKYNTPILWIGARSTTNPFSVQEIADALRGVEIPVMIKNPVNPDVELWVGALERIQKAGIEQIALIHRGFSFYGKTEYRNVPNWQLALEMKRRFSKIPFIVDPSHISGKRALLQSVIQKALDLDYDGMMIESHINPDKALSDAAQQIEPKDLDKMLGNLIWRKEGNSSEALLSELEHYRRIMDHVDDEILELIGRRMKIADDIGLIKEEYNVTIFQSDRWNKTIQRFLERARKLDLSEDFIRLFSEAIHMESIQHQGRMMNKKEK